MHRLYTRTGALFDMAMLIGKRQRVSNLREIWPKETDFSDWLVTDDGLSLIAEDIGIEVEDAQRECRPGDFPCDVVGHLLGDEGHKVVIENQFGRTNHDHLGKLLTYASMQGATTAIWLAEHVSDDHRKVIDWLNDSTPSNISFYLACIQAYRIDGSPVAPQLDVISRPNVEAKIKLTDDNPELKERHLWRRAFWEEILSYIKDQKPPFRLQAPGIDAWANIAVGRSHFNLALTLTPKRGCIGCELYMTPTWKDVAFAQLLAQREEIEAEIGESLNWQPLQGKKAARIILEAPINPRDESNRVKVKQWMHQHAVAFHKAFQPRVKLLQPGADGDNDGDDLQAGKNDTCLLGDCSRHWGYRANES